MHGLGRDIAVSAPTGSGKTLIYALSVLSGLHDRRVPRVRGVVVVPSRELARQVHAVFEALKPEMEDIPMRICLAAGQPDEQVSSSRIGTSSRRRAGRGRRRASGASGSSTSSPSPTSCPRRTASPCRKAVLWMASAT